MSQAGMEGVLDHSAQPTLRLSRWTLWTGLAVVALFVAQVLTGTSMEFAGLVAVFLSLSSATIRMVGGFKNLLGLSVAILAGQQVIVGCIAKALFVEPAEAPLKHPIETMTMFCVGMTALWVAAFIYQRLGVTKVRPLFPPVTDAKMFFAVGWILSIVSIARFIYLARFGVFEGAGGGVLIGGLVGPIRTLSFIPTLAVAFSTAAVIVQSKGQKCVGWVSALAMAGPLFMGIYTAVRTEAASAIVTFAIVLWAFSFKLRLRHYVVAIVTAYLFQGILFPYALYARGEGDVRSGTFEERVGKAFGTLLDVAVNPAKYEAKATEVNPLEPWDRQRTRYYSDPMPTLERYSNIIFIDEIVDATKMGGHTGWQTIVAGFELLVPRLFNRQKEAFGTSNSIARRGKGIVGQGDFYTQISLCFFVDAYLSFGMTGVFFVSIIIGLAYFTVYTLMFNPQLHQNVYVASLAFTTTWYFSEGTIQAQITTIVQTPIYMTIVLLPILTLARTLTKSIPEGPMVYEKRTLAEPTGSES